MKFSHRIVGIAACAHPLSACFADEKSDTHVETKQVVAFALVEPNSGQEKMALRQQGAPARHTLPMVLDKKTNEAVPAVSFESFLGLLFPSETPKKYTKAADAYLTEVQMLKGKS